MTTHVEIVQYWKNQPTGALKANFSFIAYPSTFQFRKCRHFKKDDREWFNFADEKVMKEGLPAEYFPINKVMDSTERENVNNLVIAALKNYPRKSNDKASKAETDFLQSETPSIPF